MTKQEREDWALDGHDAKNLIRFMLAFQVTILVVKMLWW
jgi:hypothetical protein